MKAAVFLGLGLACYGTAKGIVAAHAGLRPEDGHRFRSWLRAPVNEELIFRFWLNRLVGPVAGSVLFGLDHGGEKQRYPKLRVADATACGLALSGIHAARRPSARDAGALSAQRRRRPGRVDWRKARAWCRIGCEEPCHVRPEPQDAQVRTDPGPLDKREAAALAYAQKVAAKINQELGVGTPRQPAWWLWTEPRVNRSVWIGGPPPGDDYIPFPEVVIYEDTDWLSQRYGWDVFKWPSAELHDHRVNVGPRPKLAFDRNSPYEPEENRSNAPIFAHSTRAKLAGDIANARARSAQSLAETRPYSIEYASRRVVLEPAAVAHEDEVYIGDWNGD